MQAPIENSRHGLRVIWSQDELQKRTRLQRVAAHWWRRTLAAAVVLSTIAIAIGGLGIAITEGALHPYRRLPGPEDAAAARRVAAETGATVTDVPLIAHDGIVLAAWSFTRPSDSRGTVVVLHGIGDTRSSQLPLAALLLSDGYRVLVPDARAHGTSGGVMATAGIAEAADLREWTEWVRQQHPDECVFAIGTSYGGAALLQSLDRASYCAAAVEAPFVSAYSMAFYWLGGRAPLFVRWAAMGPIVEAGFAYARWHYGLRLRSLDVLEPVSRSRIPLLVIDDALDDAVPRRDAQRLRDANPGHVQVWTVEGAHHAQAFGTAPDEYRRRVLRFLSAHQ
jgi:pimeloyl-ACP methyl ester carboxylesterase